MGGRLAYDEIPPKYYEMRASLNTGPFPVAEIDIVQCSQMNSWKNITKIEHEGQNKLWTQKMYCLDLSDAILSVIYETGGSVISFAINPC
jgi:hypothetical protein